MKPLFTLLAFLTVLFSYAQTYNSPESVEYDVLHQRYIVSNTGGNNLLQVIPGSNPTNFVASGVPSPYGIAIVGDTVYVCCNSTHLRGYNLTTGVMAFDVNLGGTFLNGICTDFAGNIFVTDFTAKKVVRYNIASQQFNYFVGTAMAKTPNGIVYDPFHNRLVIATWGANASILGLSLTDSAVTTLKATTLSNIDGISIDEDGNFYGADWGSDGIYFFDSAFANAPLKAISGLSNPADISYNVLSDTVAVPNTGNNTVQFYGFLRPRAVNDYDTVAVSHQKTICVLQNDVIGGNVALQLQSVSVAQLGAASVVANCISYTAANIGNDTVSYVVCSVDTPSFCKTGTLFIVNEVNTVQNDAPVAVDDTAGMVQFGSLTVNVVANDADAIGDTLCVTGISGSNFFSLDSADCHNIIFTPDSFFTGGDTCLYVICDNGSPALCDTAMLVVNVTGLPPVASFVVAFGNFNCYSFTTINTSTGDTGTATWLFSPSFTSSMTLYGDTGYYLNMNMHGFYGDVCLYVSNQFGSDTICHTYNYICEGVNNASIESIHLFPNPVNDRLTIDWQNSSEEIIRTCSFIEIVNAAGSVLKTIVNKPQGRILTVDVSDLTSGVYYVVAVSDKKARKTLDKFAIAR